METEAEIKREYAIDKKQRDYENNIRQMKVEEKQLRAAGFDKDAADLRKKWRRLTVDYKIYSLDNDRAYYPYRYIVDKTEIPDNNFAEAIDIPIKNAIMEPRYISIESGVFSDKAVRRTFAGIDISKVDPRVAELYESLANIEGVSVLISGKGRLQGNAVYLNSPSTVEGRFTNTHELGHLINQRYNDRGVFWNDSLSQRSNDLKVAINEEKSNYKDAMKNIEQTGALSTKEKREVYKRDNPIQSIYDEKVQNFKNSFQGTQLEFMRGLEKIKVQTEKDYNQTLNNLWENMEDQSNLTLCDMFDGMTGGGAYENKVIPAGHGMGYYSTYSMVQEELFANFLSLKVMGAEKQLNIFKELYPKTYNAINSVVDKAVEVKNGRR